MGQFEMTGIEAEAEWSEDAHALCRLYQSIQPALDDLPTTEMVEIARRIATDIVFRLAAREGSSEAVTNALTSISAVCQSCSFERSTANPA